MTLDPEKKKFLYFFYFSIYVIIFFTNSHFDFQESLFFGGADGQSYMTISQNAPFITSEQIMPIHSERFFFPYLIGLISKLLNIEIFLTYKILIFVILFFINFYLFNIFIFLKLEKDFIIILLAIVNLNPYISRFYIAVPTIINDLIFILGTTIIFKNILEKKKLNFLFLLGCILSFASRQTGIAYLIAYFAKILICKKRILDFRSEFLILCLFIFLLVLSIFYSNHTFTDPNARSELYTVEMRIFGLFLQKISLQDKLLFLALPILSFGPMLLYFALFRKIKVTLNSLIKSKILIFLSVFIFLVVLQPVLSGPEITNRNIIRLTTLAFIPLLILLILITEKKNNKYLSSKMIVYLFYLITITQSLHPTFSKIQVFDILKF